nr:hypothetical protein [Candidatus Levybacteria bacterium]
MKLERAVERLKRPDAVVVFNCAWHNPPGSEARKALEASLKPNEVISDGMCDPCFAEQNAFLAQMKVNSQK